jgi:phosphoribosylaminoimidazole synthetase
MQSNNINSTIYLYKEESARANALIKHINKYNPEVLIEEVVEGKIDFLFCASRDASRGDSKNYYFILNEKGIQSFHNYVSSTANAACKCDTSALNLVFPTLEQSYLETSKLYCREFLSRVGLEYLNPQYVVITKDTNLAVVNFNNRVIKADGLASGKGVFVYADHFKTDDEAKKIVMELLEKNERILLEEKLEGEEFSCITLSWNGVMTHFPLVKDFKRLEDNDKGPNTGGMGTISFAGGSMPFLSEDELNQCKSINETIIIETHFRGFLYGSFMKTRDGKLKIIEYNVRLGDSEAVNILALLESSLIAHLEDPGKNPLVINIRDNTYFRYLVPRDYARSTGLSVSVCGFEKNNKRDRYNKYYLVDHNMPVDVFYLANSNYLMEINLDSSRVLERDKLSDVGGLYTIGTSRTCGILSRNIDASVVVAENDKLVGLVYGDLHYRHDIGKKMLDMLSKMNYIGHLDNYNHIITDVKKRIDLHNLEVELSNPGLSVLGRIGDFANSVQIGKCRMICSVDGAGTKTKFLEGHPRRFEILGRDIVIHNINDMYCNNGIPVALLDYYGCDKLDKQEFAQFINGALDICREYGIALIGGETAEMRGIFQTGEVEVLGILLGILEGGKGKGPEKGPENGVNIQEGHFIYGLESHGAHTNGFTKLRDVASNTVDGMPSNVKEFFSQPHRCYVRAVNHLAEVLKILDINITGKAHITGGGFQDNIERLLSDRLGVELGIKLGIKLEKWQLGVEWQWLYDNAGMTWDEFIRVFNAGWGFCVIVDKEIPDIVLVDFENRYGNGKIKLLGQVIKKMK